MRCLFSADELKTLRADEIDRTLDEAFAFDGFRDQRESGTRIKEPFRADGLERILYKCVFCGAEGQMVGKGVKLTCSACGKTHTMTELGELSADAGETKFSHIPDWYRYERECIKKELDAGTYRLDTAVDIVMLVDHRSLYRVGEGRLTHDETGFTLTGCNGELSYTQPIDVSHSLNTDYYWYEMGDVIGIGNRDALYYCFPKDSTPVAKVRLAAEELYKRSKKTAVR